MHHVREPFRLINQIYGICLNQVYVKSRAPEEGAANAIIVKAITANATMPKANTAKANTANATMLKANTANATMLKANTAKAVMAYANTAHANAAKAIMTNANTAHAIAEIHFSLSEPVEVFKHGAQVRHIFLIGNGGISREFFAGKVFTACARRTALFAAALVNGTSGKSRIFNPPRPSLNRITAFAFVRLFCAFAANNAARRD